MNIRVTLAGSPHDYAQCQECSWDSSKSSGRGISTQARRHAARTGHKVIREHTRTTHYTPEA